jgi:NADPH-dependent curcumin reductase
MISSYNEPGQSGYVSTGPRNLFQLAVRRVRMEGFIVLDYWNRADEAIGALAGWYREGKLKYRVHVIDGLENAPEALNLLFDGRNQGTLIVKI